MNKVELIAAMAAQTEMTKKDTEAALKAIVNVVSNSLTNGEDVKISGFGTFTTVDRAAREGRNPQTGETIQIAASKAVKFKPAKAFKETVNA